MSALEIILIAFVLLGVFSIAWYTVKTGISPMPSSAKAYKTILKHAEVKGEGPIIDLGSGWGTLIVAFARKYPHKQVIGYELSLLPWLFSIIRKKLLRLNNLQIYRRDFFNVDLKTADLLVCYLFPKGMRKLKQKLDADNNPVNIVSNTFALPNSNASMVIKLDDAFHTPVYFYRC